MTFAVRVEHELQTSKWNHSISVAWQAQEAARGCGPSFCGMGEISCIEPQNWQQLAIRADLKVQKHFFHAETRLFRAHAWKTLHQHDKNNARAAA